MAQAPVAISIDDSDVEDDLIAKLTGRLDLVFESARQLKVASGRGGGELRSGRYNTRFSLNKNMTPINEELNFTNVFSEDKKKRLSSASS